MESRSTKLESTPAGLTLNVSSDALSAHVILDGHDRLAAALDVGVNPQVITLWQFIDAPIDADAKVDVDTQSHFIDSYLQLFDNPNVELMARRQLNAKLIAQHASTWRKRVTLAKANPALDETWEEEVRAAAPSDAQDVLDDMLFG